MIYIKSNLILMTHELLFCLIVEPKPGFELNSLVK